MPTKDQYEQARANVAAGRGSASDNELVNRGAKQAGSWGQGMRDAQKKGAKQSNRSSSWF
jgi:hypothetical protein